MFIIRNSLKTVILHSSLHIIKHNKTSDNMDMKCMQQTSGYRNKKKLLPNVNASEFALVELHSKSFNTRVTWSSVIDEPPSFFCSLSKIPFIGDVTTKWETLSLRTQFNLKWGLDNYSFNKKHVSLMRYPVSCYIKWILLDTLYILGILKKSIKGPMSP
jgi:hypothetical protein